MSGRTVFITGTDTGAGKTRVACALLRRAREEGVEACGYKPVASGCTRTRAGLRNEDALALQAAAGTREPYAEINPYAFEPAIAPHLAAREAGVRVSTLRLAEQQARLAARHELVIVEGAGGWLVPLNEDLSFGGWVAQQGWPVLLVVGLRLGCLNHALLSVEAISRRAPLLGWMGSVLPPAMERLEENLAELRRRIPAPCLGVLAEGAENLDAEFSVRAALLAPASAPELL